MTSTTKAAATGAFFSRWWIALAGAALLLLALGLSALQQADAADPACARAPIPAGASTLYTASRSIALNNVLCMAVDMQAYAAVAPPVAVPTAPSTTASPSTQQAYVRLQLYIDGLPAPTPPVYAALPSAAAPAQRWQWVRFALATDSDATSDDAAQWRAILTGPSETGSRPVEVGIGTFGDPTPVPRVLLADPLDLRIYTPWHAVVSAAGMLLLFGGLVRGGWDGGLLRDPGGAFSLSRVQTLFWLALSFGGFLYIWLVSGEWAGVMTANVLTLIGIAGVTGVSARVIDQQGAPPPASSGSFFTDLLSDGASGLSVHRIQLMLWNIVLGAIFVWTAWWDFAFPAFDSNLLILAGLVNATYLGFKVPEKQAAIAAASPTASTTSPSPQPAPT